MNNNMYAKYTETFHDFLKRNPYFLEHELHFPDNERTEKFHRALISKYNLYEIGGETEEMFKIMLKDVFELWNEYYAERISAYEKQYDYTIGNRRRTLKSSNVHSTSNQYNTDTSDNKHTDIELPNKKVSDDYEGYPNAISKDKNVIDSYKDYSSDSNLNDEVTTIFDDEFLDLKNKYLAQLRNIYLEFADKFKECFIIIY